MSYMMSMVAAIEYSSSIPFFSTRTIPGVGDVSTTQSAGPSDFNWVNADYAAGKTPADAIIIENPADMKGRWKAYTYGTGTEHLFHMDISAAGTDVSGVIHWSQVRDSSGNIHDDNTPDSVFSGTMIDGMLDATGPGRIMLIKSWYAGNAEYAVGTFMWPSGETDTLVLMRP